MATAALRATVRAIPSSSLHVSTPVDWLTSRFHFSFADYHDPRRSNYGVLRVLNDDLVAPQSGFDTHPHSNMEILSYVVQGHLTHRDSMGSAETLGRGAIQFMSAGTGVRHSEHNRDAHGTLRFLQLWITPAARGLKPQYGSRSFTEADRTNRLLHVVTGPTAAAAAAAPASDADPRRIVLNQDANIYVTEYDADHPQTLPVRVGRQVYVVCIEGEARVDAVALAARDAATIAGPGDVVLSTPSRAHLLLVEMAASA
jgi:quercetin 2,3-dioxygenase